MTNKIFVTIYGNVATLLQDSSSSTQTIIKSLCNRAYQEILKRFNYNRIHTDNLVSVVAGTREYGMPLTFKKEHSVYDKTNKKYIPYISYAELVDKFQDSLETTGPVERYTIIEAPTNVAIKTAIGTTIEVYSSSAADTTQTVNITRTNGGVETLTLTGTTHATSSINYKAGDIISITKSATTTGYTYVYATTDAVVLATMSPWQLVSRVKRLFLHYTPTSAITLNVPYYGEALPLINDTDAPEFDCADGIELLALAYAWRYKRQFAKAQEYERLFEKWIVDAMWDVENQPNQTHLINPKTYDRDYV